MTASPVSSARNSSGRTRSSRTRRRLPEPSAKLPPPPVRSVDCHISRVPINRASQSRDSGEDWR
jgi:hypothetical protein